MIFGNEHGTRRYDALISLQTRDVFFIIIFEEPGNVCRRVAHFMRHKFVDYISHSSSSRFSPGPGGSAVTVLIEDHIIATLIGKLDDAEFHRQFEMAASIEHAHAPLMDRLNTLVDLQRQGQRPPHVYAEAIARQAHAVLDRAPGLRLFSPTPILCSGWVTRGAFTTGAAGAG